MNETPISRLAHMRDDVPSDFFLAIWCDYGWYTILVISYIPSNDIMKDGGS